MKTKYIEQLRQNIGAKMSGQIPGFSSWLDGRVTQLSEQGDLQMEFEVREDMLNPMGNIHGGAVAAIIDEILGFQVFLQSEETAAYVSMTMNIDFLNSAQVGDIITAIPKVVRIGKRTANVSCVLNSASGKIISQATSNFMRVV